MRLSDDARAEALHGLPDWAWDADAQAIRRSFRFRDFPEAFGFMTRVALAAEKADHHPDWSNSWNRVDVALSTHSEGGVTSRDVDLAKRIDAFASLAPPPPPH
ncbi:MAG: 4a-hydroxytetrahydrobiopterin dehydratase [Alphaproteobacteria bacterium]|nr:4a-hydroxytetrahydrobiopterin dehydratase [Alphaproteobacteria bacterium]